MNDARSTSHDEHDPSLDLFLQILYERFHYDFRSYARRSLARRVEAARESFGCASLESLTEHVLADPSVFLRLLGYLTVQVSEMFRDPGYFRTFRARVVPELRTYPFVRIWVAGCSAGEEAYSIAIILKEEGILHRSLIYATDINPDALRIAETGAYDIERIPVFSASHRGSGARISLSEHYTTQGNIAVFDRALRKRIVFSDHSLATDAVFAEVQVVSCRNVLIYFDRALQDRAIGLFRGGLCHRGFLGLGTRESVYFSRHAQAFTELTQEDRWYRRT